MKLDEFIKLCASHDWSKLISFLQSDVKDLSTKILVSAIIQSHHPDTQIAKKYSLHACWSANLSAKPVTPMLAMLASTVDLSDFAAAYLLAKSKDLNDEKTASAIHEFVKANKLQLGQYLKSHAVPEDQKHFIAQLFDELVITKEQKETFFKRNFAQQAKQKISFLQAIDQVNMDIVKLFGLAQNDFQVTFQKKSNMEGIASNSLSSEGNISFNKAISNNLIKTVVEILKQLEISGNYYNMSFYTGRDNSRGIQLWSSPEDIHKKFVAYSFIKGQPKSEFDTQRFFKIGELTNEIKMLLVEAHENKTENKLKI